MSVFALKLIAVLSMVTDHTAYMLACAQIIAEPATTVLRSIGRLAFPIYCFLIVNGMRRTSDTVMYMTRLCVFALISQLPFTLLVCIDNYAAAYGLGGLRLVFGNEANAFALLSVSCAAAWYFIVQKKRRSPVSAAAVAIFTFLPCVKLYFGGITLLDGYMDVFYTLALGLACICLLDRVRALAAGERSPYPPWQLAVLAALLALQLWQVQPRADYGLAGLALIAALYLCGERRAVQGAVICLWGSLLYWLEYSSPAFALSCCLAALPLMLYRGERGKSFKLGFYLIYPVHLMILGLINIILI